MKTLIFCPTARLEAETVAAILSQDVERFDTLFTRDNPYKGGDVYRNIQINFEKMRKFALSENYDKVLVVESDMIPPRDALSKLIEVNAPIVSALYCLRHGEPPPNIIRPKGSKDLQGLFTWEDIKKNWGKTIEIGGGGTGCLLIDKSILSVYCFDFGNTELHDGPFMNWCEKNNIKQLARLDVCCGHKKLNGSILWPDENTGYRIEQVN